MSNVSLALNKSQRWLRDLSTEMFEQALEEFQPQMHQILSKLPDYERPIVEASIKQIQRRKPHPFSNPYYWAAFTALGG
jgi:CHAT domain-containing protein